ncbi:ORF6N domain-containing protein [Bacteroides sp. An19]|uniref:ORF6N domain-containing protein n=1 Tax=Bacteroides sp. An19 TaxID=1965580 RepID=UPI000B38EBCE|nr:ORF6N domain-containing protein [Bacteroides sp. An19]OUP30376.1 DNA-binding protein [Bacteroides sp. An19]
MDKNNDLNERAERIPQRTVNLFEQVRQKIILIRDCQVILDVDVAELYGVETKRVNEAVRNNPDKFPQGYVFQLSDEEMEYLRSKNSTANLSPKTRVLPKAFTEKGLYMLATILKSPQATQATLAIIETFASVRQLKRELHALHGETDGKSQQSKMQHIGEMLSSIVMPDLETSETESSLELNFLIGKIKHTVKRVKRQNDADHTEVE